MIALYSLLVTIVALINRGPHHDDPNLRMRELMGPDPSGQIEYEWKGRPFTDQPSHMPPERVHGGIQ